MAKRYIYNENLIIHFSSTDFQAFTPNDDGDIETKQFHSLDSARKWIDKKIIK